MSWKPSRSPREFFLALIECGAVIECNHGPYIPAPDISSAAALDNLPSYIPWPQIIPDCNLGQLHCWETMLVDLWKWLATIYSEVISQTNRGESQAKYWNRNTRIKLVSSLFVHGRSANHRTEWTKTTKEFLHGRQRKQPEGTWICNQPLWSYSFANLRFVPFERVLNGVTDVLSAGEWNVAGSL